ncbi:hypothetical protein [Shewanella woodyi]|uniref:hypothetical protein n=1 Tax=Shewanella woodyi TaxID=60961 RepID=UPI00374945B2
MNFNLHEQSQISGEFINIDDERFYVIRNTDLMAPFFVSVISNSDHWLFVSSTGGLTAGRVSPETALFPYITVDKIHESSLHTGSKTLIKLTSDDHTHHWEPFNKEHDHRYQLTRNIYKNVLGNKLCFEEVNHDLQLQFRYTWLTSEKYGFVRKCELVNLSNTTVCLELIDGLQNILPAGTPRFTQTNSSNLVDAYKWSELDKQTQLAYFALYSGITDRAEPCESLKANTVFCLGLDHYQVLLSNEQLSEFRNGKSIRQETHKRGVRGAYLISTRMVISASGSQQWQLVSNIEQSQSQIVNLRNQLSKPDEIESDIAGNIHSGSDQLTRIMGAADAFQYTAQEDVTVHHYANVVFNILRGGAFDDQYQISLSDFITTISLFNRDVFLRHQAQLNTLQEPLDFTTLLSYIKQLNDPQLERLCYEYLPISFGRRHGDPSRPWNQFAIKLIDENNNKLLTYQGNWRDIFQNWEALSFSYPEFIENVIAKFVNASTMDGYNPYRITKEGIDWEVEEPDDPWSYIGYWGDHQIIYLQKMLELSNQFHPKRLSALLYRDIFSYANVPYRIGTFEALVKDAKSTVTYDDELAALIEHRVESMGADGKLVLDRDNQVYQVNLLEKLLVPLLCKLGNLVIDGGLWLNTQRPEWNDANNALVGQGLSIVTLCYLRRYVNFLLNLLAKETKAVSLSTEVCDWLNETATALSKVRPLLNGTELTPQQRYQSLAELGRAASDYRQSVYQEHPFSGKKESDINTITQLLEDARLAIDHTINTNRTEIGLYNAYNLLDIQSDAVNIGSLYPMLEGQVAALSSGVLPSSEAINLLETLFESDIYRADQQSFMLYPDRELPSFLEKNIIPKHSVIASPLLKNMVEKRDERIIVQDSEGVFRFNAELSNANDLIQQLEIISTEPDCPINANKESILELYESVFNHKAFTGRSGGMFGFEGLGCIYWHMVSKLLLATMENFFTALQQNDTESTQALGQLYYRIRAGIGFNKNPEEYGAFPTDPYSHTPKTAGAQQPGMTGQVKEEILTRFGELGIRVSQGEVHFQPNLLRAAEFTSQAGEFTYLDVNNQWQKIAVPSSSLSFTWCQVPIIYQLNDELAPQMSILWSDGREKTIPHTTLSSDLCYELFMRNGNIRQIKLTLNSTQLLANND